MPSFSMQRLTSWGRRFGFVGSRDDVRVFEGPAFDDTDVVFEDDLGVPEMRDVFALYSDLIEEMRFADVLDLASESAWSVDLRALCLVCLKRQGPGGPEYEAAKHTYEARLTADLCAGPRRAW